MSIKSVYVACPWALKDSVAKEVRDKCLRAGLKVTSRWISLDSDEGACLGMQQEAINDFVDVHAADALLLMNLQKRGEETSGKAVETGLALAWNKPVYMVGGSSNVFHYLPEVIKCGSVEEAIDRMVGNG